MLCDLRSAELLSLMLYMKLQEETCLQSFKHITIMWRFLQISLSLLLRHQTSIENQTYFTTKLSLQNIKLKI